MQSEDVLVLLAMIILIESIPVFPASLLLCFNFCSVLYLNLTHSVYVQIHTVGCDVLHTADKTTRMHGWTRKEESMPRYCQLPNETMINLSQTVIKMVLFICFTFYSEKQETVFIKAYIGSCISSEQGRSLYCMCLGISQITKEQL